jgi:hypothetical protein
MTELTTEVVPRFIKPLHLLDQLVFSVGVVIVQLQRYG